jgi:phosphoserine phosphatase
MSFIATLISSSGILSPAIGTMAMEAVGASAIEWLAERTACEFALPENIDAETLELRLRETLAAHPVDIVVQPAVGRRKKILIADMDSTMIDQECIDELADEIGMKDHIAAITARAMNGEITFEPALRERVLLLKGLPVPVISTVLDTRITLAAGGRELVATMKKNGAHTALVSGGFTAFTGAVAERLGFDENVANELLEENGVLTGKVVEPILGRRAKADALVKTAARLGLTPADAMAVGDGANDLDMIRLAGSGVALHAKPSVAAQARIRIDHGDLTALLYMQGYRQSEFVR